MGDLWNTIIFNPMVNSMIVIYGALGHNFFLSILALTLIVRLLILPLTLRQLQTSKAISALQPKLTELQKKYAKDKARLAQEQMKLYKEAKVNPAGCLVTTLIQFPVWIALYQAIIIALATTPEALLSLSQHLYNWPTVYQLIPLKEHFLWLNLAEPDRNFILPILVAGSMWVLQKMTVMPSLDPRQQSMTNMMNTLMPLMFGFMTIQFPSGLAIYWVASNIISIVIQYFITGWGSLRRTTVMQPVARPVPKKLDLDTKGPAKSEALADNASTIEEKEEGERSKDDGLPGGERKDSGRGYPTRSATARREARRSRGHRHQKR